MKTAGSKSRSRTPGSKASAVRRRRARKAPVRLAETELMSRIREGVEQFILRDATVDEFLTMIRALSEEEKSYSHQLTKGIFSKIVKQAIRKRNQRWKKKRTITKSRTE